MGQAVRDTMTALRELGSVADLRALAAKGYGPDRPPSVNAHVHLPPNFSAFQSVEQAVDLAAGEGVGVLGSTNYYDYDVYGPFAASARQHGIFPLFGLEIISMDAALQKAGVLINDPGNPGKFYVCGKGATLFDPMSERARELLQRIRDNDVQRMSEMIDRTARVFADRGLVTGLTTDSVIDMVVRRHGCEPDTVYLQERHIAQAFQQAIFGAVAAPDRPQRLRQILDAEPKATDPEDFVGIQNDIRTHLLKAGKPAFVDEA
ncbi:MAG: hypothetical protein OER86_00155, partial [Phycisphaerae bacterium]|nr:hypothetical protein [Phycisphaerae bacterium]